MSTPERERRTSEAPLEIREALPDVPGDVLEGYAAIYNAETVIGGFMREVLLPGAFADVLRDDVRALYNHDPSQVLGRTRAGTLALSEDGTGLRYRVTLPNTTLARDLMTSVKRGDVTQSSFAFTVKEEGWVRATKPGELPLRQIKKIGELYDVSPVTYPAYEATSVSARAKVEAASECVPLETPEPDPVPAAVDRTRRKRWVTAAAETHRAIAGEGR